MTLVVHIFADGGIWVRHGHEEHMREVTREELTQLIEEQLDDSNGRKDRAS